MAPPPRWRRPGTGPSLDLGSWHGGPLLQKPPPQVAPGLYPGLGNGRPLADIEAEQQAEADRIMRTLNAQGSNLVGAMGVSAAPSYTSDPNMQVQIGELGASLGDMFNAPEIGRLTRIPQKTPLVMENAPRMDASNAQTQPGWPTRDALMQPGELGSWAEKTNPLFNSLPTQPGADVLAKTNPSLGQMPARSMEPKTEVGYRVGQNLVHIGRPDFVGRMDPLPMDPGPQARRDQSPLLNFFDYHNKPFISQDAQWNKYMDAMQEPATHPGIPFRGEAPTQVSQSAALRSPAALFKTPGRNGTELMNGPPGPAPEVPIPTQLGNPPPPPPPPYGTDVRIPEGFNPAMPSAGISGKDAAKMLAATGGAGLLSALAYQAHQARANAPMGIPAIPKPTAIPKNENPVTDGANDPWLSQTKAHAQAALGPDTSPEQLQQVMQVLQAMNAMRPPR